MTQLKLGMVIESHFTPRWYLRAWWWLRKLLLGYGEPKPSARTITKIDPVTRTITFE